MHGAYTSHGDRAAYWVVVRLADGAVVGAGGFAALVGGDEGTCELRKMYFYPELRGLGLGSELLGICLDGAARAGFSRMYLETLASMSQARALYEKQGFAKRSAPLGNTGHSGCNTFYERSLAST
jgi:putative acetyltransferase